MANDPFPDYCPSCGARVGDVPYDYSGRPALVVCFSHDPPAVLCEACRESHAGCGPLRRQEKSPGA